MGVGHNLRLPFEEDVRERQKREAVEFLGAASKVVVAQCNRNVFSSMHAVIYECVFHGCGEVR